MSGTQIAIADVCRRDADGSVWTDSRVVADKFGRQHKDVLRAIGNLECSDDFKRRNFTPLEYMGSKQQSYPYFRMSRDGFSFLAMGFTGKEAAAWKERFIAAFNAMETALIDGNRDHDRWLKEILDRQQKNMDALSGAAAVQIGRINVVETKVESFGARIEHLERQRQRKRREIPRKVKNLHAHTVHLMGGRCPCCYNIREKLEFDHFFNNQMPDFVHSWPLCEDCHDQLTHGRKSRAEVRSRFDAYQERAKELINPESFSLIAD